MTEIVLGIDTCVQVSVGLADGEKILASLTVGDSRSHLELLTPTIKQVIASAEIELADLSRIIVGVGPGPFTGLRVGIATARALGLALALPVSGVCSLDLVALAQAGVSESDFLAVIDARRHEVYWASYDRSGLRTDGPFVGSPASLPAFPVYGPGVEAYPDLANQLTRSTTIDAGLLASAWQRLPDVGLEPLYLRQPDAELPSTRKSTIQAGRVPLTKDLV